MSAPAANPYDWAVQGPPVGVWRTAEGSFSAVAASVLTLRPDGTGTVEHVSPLSGDRLMHLLWRFREPGRLELFQSEHADALPREDGDWDVVPYKADWRRWDVGAGPVLVNDGTQGWFPADGFWTLLAPVHLVGRAEG